MSARLLPSASDVLKAIGDGMDRVLLPALKTQAERSAGATLRHLVRYVGNRIDVEGQMLFDEQRKLQGLLQDGAAYLDTRDIPAAAPLAASIRASLIIRHDPTIYVGVLLLSEDVAGLRQHVTDLLIFLQVDKANQAGHDLHACIRSYIAWQLLQESNAVEPAFRGHGVRR